MGAFIGYGNVGVWASNRERDAFLDWFADHRCSKGDPRWEFCKSEGNRWTGCGVKLRHLLAPGQPLAVTDEEYFRAAEAFWPEVAQLLGIIDSITRGEWQIRVDSKAATDWRRQQRFPAIDPAWLTENVVQLATAIDGSRGFDGLPILADALEDAGCTNGAILVHCRRRGAHDDGSWVVDLILGKE